LRLWEKSNFVRKKLYYTVICAANVGYVFLSDISNKYYWKQDAGPNKRGADNFFCPILSIVSN